MNVTSVVEKALNQIEKNVTGYLEGYSFSLWNIPGNMRKHAIALASLILDANTTFAEVSPMAYTICLGGCYLLYPPFVPICLFECLPLLPAPSS